MNMTSSTCKNVLAVCEALSSSLDCKTVRQRVGEAVMYMLNADFYASYTWDCTRHAFEGGIHINMDNARPDEYERYYQFRDPITRRLQHYHRGVSVNEVMPQEQLVQTEFFNDYLSRDGLYSGVNLYVYEGSTNIGDMRIWRTRGRGNFSRQEVALLDLIAPHFRNAMRNARNVAAAAALPLEKLACYNLTPREIEVVRELLRGARAQDIARHMYIGVSTLNTHVRHIYNKMGIHSRACLFDKLHASGTADGHYNASYKSSRKGSGILQNRCA